MANARTEIMRRKHCGLDLQQLVIEVRIYKRPLSCAGGKSCALLGFAHEAAVATTMNARLYLIEKGVSLNDDINHRIRYREGDCRVAEISRREIRDWQFIRSVENVNLGVTLEDLFDSCGYEYGTLTDNCWNATQRIRARANPAEDGMTWQGKAILGVAGVVAGVAAVAIAGKCLAETFPSKSDEQEKNEQ